MTVNYELLPMRDNYVRKHITGETDKSLLINCEIIDHVNKNGKNLHVCTVHQ